MSCKNEEVNHIQLSRRSFLTCIAGAAITFAVPGAIATTIPVADRELSFYNTHTGEKLSATYWSGGKYLDDGVEEISWLLRDHRASETTPIDTRLLDLLHQLQARVVQQGEFHVISGYRSPATNKMLIQSTSGVAKRSYHMSGQAIDVRLPGFDTAKLRQAAVSLKGGGVGYYASSDFVHLDVGRIRSW